MPDPAATLYEGYRAAMGKGPAWQDLSALEQSAWWAALRAYHEMLENSRKNALEGRIG